MADAFVQILLENLNALIRKEVGLLWGVDKDMNKLSSLLSTIQAVLEDAEEKQVQDKALQNWLQKLKEAAYKVDDILDDCATEVSRLDSKYQNSRFINKKFQKAKELAKNRVRLSCLKLLTISECPELEAFPEQVTGRPKLSSAFDFRNVHKVLKFVRGLRHLSALKSWALDGCPELVTFRIVSNNFVPSGS
ncbi:putative disease resistance protein RGA4 [Pistacia vera]|uniref:putative disease resistance protein RGA4 n=1 Tax=Pistacia vera TaxID=55513 RepID=UPI001262CDE6|nr:putative disease resistance protein RGA4 [Pistacia vera]